MSGSCCRRVRWSVGVVAMCLLVGCASTPESTPTTASQPVEPTAIAVESSTPTAQLKTACEVDALVSLEDFVLGEGVQYRDDSLVIRQVGIDLQWEMNGESGLLYQGTEVPAEEVEERGDGYNVGQVTVNDRWVIFETTDSPWVGEPWQLHAWDRTKPHDGVWQFAAHDPALGPADFPFPKLNGDRVVWNATISEEEAAVMVYDLASRETRELARGLVAWADFADQDTAVWKVYIPGSDDYNMAGVNLATGQPWQQPAEFAPHIRGLSPYSVDEWNWILVYDPGANQEYEDQVAVAWPAGAAEPYEFFRSRVDGYWDDTVGAGEGYFFFIEYEGFDAVSYLLDVQRGIKFRLFDDWLDGEIRNGVLHLHLPPEDKAAGVETLKMLEIPLAEFAAKSC